MSLVAPGSIPWLLRHELRVALREFGGRAGRSRTRVAVRWVAAVAAVAALGGLLGAPLALAAHRLHVSPDPATLLAIDVAMAVLWTLMLSQSLNAATQALYERNDLDLLLSSPLPPHRVLTVRALGIAVLVAALYLALASLFVLPSLFLGEFRWLALYAVIASLALSATAAGLLLAMALFAALGPKRTRTLSQVIAALIGAVVFLGAQLRNFLSGPQRAALWTRLRGARGGGFDAHAFYAWPARALIGEPVATLGLGALSIAVFALVTMRLGRRFGRDASAATSVGHSGATRPARAAARTTDFRGGAFHMLVRKERRLLTRDPWLISQMLLQCIYILPLGFVIARNAQNNALAAVAAGGAAATFICGQLAGNLVWVTVAAEACPELIACAPLTVGETLRAKLLVALTPVAALALVPLTVIAGFTLTGAAIAAAGCALAAFASACLNLWWSKPGQRRDFRRRRSSSGLIGMAEVAVLFATSAATWLAISRNPWAAAPALLVVVMLVVMRRPIRFTAES